MDLTYALAVLDRRFHIAGQSDHVLVAQVQRHIAALQANSPATSLAAKTLVPATGVHAGVTVRLSEVLLQLAEATALLISDDVFDWYRHWAQLRYLGAFEANGANIRLSQAASKAPTNQRRVISEELGIGFGIMIAREWMQAATRSPHPIQVVDVDIALNDPLHWVNTKVGIVAANVRQPDYLLLQPMAHNPRYFHVRTLECKGTVNQSYAVAQLARAVTQLDNLTLSGACPSGIAIDTISNRGGVKFKAVDPPDDGYNVSDNADSFYVEVGDDDFERADNVHFPQGAHNGRRDIESGVAVARSRMTGHGALADFGGNMEAAERLLPRGTYNRVQRRARVRVVREVRGSQFVGVESIMPIPEGGHVGVFHGVEMSIDQVLTEWHPHAVTERQLEFTSQHLHEINQPGGEAESTISVLASSGDGAIRILRQLP